LVEFGRESGIIPIANFHTKLNKSKNIMKTWEIIGQSMPSRHQMEACGVKIFDRSCAVRLIEKLQSADSTLVEGKIYKLVGIAGSEFKPAERSNRNVLRVAKERGYVIPPAEIAGLIALQVPIADFGAEQVVIMHNVVGRDFQSRLYFIVRDNVQYIDTCSSFDSDVWQLENDIIFIFLAPL
jgi:hypothetical protein